MKILVLWSYSTGKTTIINEIQKVYKDMDFFIVPDTAREIIEEKQLNVNGMTKDEVIRFQMEIFERVKLYKEKLKDNSNYIIDWGEILLLIYFFDVNPHLKKYAPFIKEVYDEFYKTNYDLILYTPIEFWITDDWIRHKDYVKRINIDKQIQSYLDATEMPHLYLTGSIKNRMKLIDKFINENLKINNKENYIVDFSKYYWTCEIETELKELDKDKVELYKKDEFHPIFKKLSFVLGYKENN